MNAKAKSNSVITTTVADGVITFHVKGAGDLALPLASIHDSVRQRAMIHGFIQRVSDKAAIPCDTTTGLPATAATKLAAMRALVDHFMSGTEEWAPKRAEGAVRKSAGLDALAIAAVVEATGKDEAAVRELIKKGADAKSCTPVAFLAALSAAAKVAPILARLREEQAAKTELDGDDLLEGLGE